MTSQIQGSSTARGPRLIITRGSTSVTVAATFIATNSVISAEIDDELSVAELAAAAAGEAEIERGDFVTLDELERDDDE